MLSFLATVIVITASGALTPGPLFVGTLIQSSKEGARAGVLVAVGHTIVELPLVFLLALGLINIGDHTQLKSIISLVGGITLIILGVLQVNSMFKSNPIHIQSIGKGWLHNSLILGVILTGLNPFFIMWWLTIGTTLIINALILAALWGVVIMYVAHVWMDYAWLTFIASLSRKGFSILGSRGYRIVIGSLGLLLIYFGINFISSALA
ncbi:MAG: LysE family translocator [Nitrososphaerales archaeon]|nr:LysE family translocator [Nitrososphaerales archaeon]